MGDVTGYGGDDADLAVLEREGTVERELVGCGVVVSNLHGDGGVCKGLVGVGEGRAEAGYGGCGLVGDCGDGPAVPVYSTVFEVRDLRWE